MRTFLVIFLRYKFKAIEHSRTAGRTNKPSKRTEVKQMDDNKTVFPVNLNFSSLDEKLKKFVILRNEMVLLAKEIGVETKDGLLELKVK